MSNPVEVAKMKRGKVDPWETRQDMEALQRVAEMKKDPARKKACCEAMKGHHEVMGMVNGKKKAAPAAKK